jgi:hypothetical protein
MAQRQRDLEQARGGAIDLTPQLLRRRPPREVELQSDIYIPAPVSPPLEPRRLGNLYQIRIHTLRPGGIFALALNPFPILPIPRFGMGKRS